MWRGNKFALTHFRGSSPDAHPCNYTVPSFPLIFETPTLQDTLGTPYFDLVGCPPVTSINNADLQTPLNYHSSSSPYPGHLQQNTPVSSLPTLSSSPSTSPTTSTSVSLTETQNAVMHLSQIHNLESHQASLCSGDEVNTTQTSFVTRQRQSSVSHDAFASSTSDFSNLSSALPHTVEQRRLSDNYPATPLHQNGPSNVFINAGTSYQSTQLQSSLSDNINTRTVFKTEQSTSCMLSGFSSSQLNNNGLSAAELACQIVSRNNFSKLLVSYPASYFELVQLQNKPPSFHEKHGD